MAWGTCQILTPGSAFLSRYIGKDFCWLGDNENGAGPGTARPFDNAILEHVGYFCLNSLMPVLCDPVGPLLDYDSQ